MMQCGAGREISDNLEASARLQKGWQMDFITCQLRKTVDGLYEMESQATSRLSQQRSDRLAMPAIHWVWRDISYRITNYCILHSSNKYLLNSLFHIQTHTYIYQVSFYTEEITKTRQIRRVARAVQEIKQGKRQRVTPEKWWAI